MEKMVVSKHTKENLKMKKILIVGLGIGKLYKDFLDNKKYHITTIDPNISKNADFMRDDVFNKKSTNIIFHMTIICSPNYLHERHIKMFAPISEIVLVEKPGVKSLKIWKKLQKKYSSTKIIMVKNNMYRCDEKSLYYLSLFRKNYYNFRDVFLYWMSSNRIPFPGFWFTQKKYAFGGVSYDLMPHMIHFAMLLSGCSDVKINYKYKSQEYKMKDIISTDYGIVNPKKPIYNVDDRAFLFITIQGKVYRIITAWKYGGHDKQIIEFGANSWNFGMCPESAYVNMVDTIISGKDTLDHKKIDETVIRIIENI